MRKKVISCVICALMIATVFVIEVPKDVSAQVIEEWVARYDGTGKIDEAQAITTDFLGNVYVTGWSESGYINYDYVTIKYDPAGNECWVARYNGPANHSDMANAIATDLSGNVYITGASYGIGTWLDYTTIKYNGDGNELWVARYNGPGNDHDLAYTITIDLLGNIYISGRSQGVGTHDDYATVAYDTFGNELWVARYNGPMDGYDCVLDIVTDSLANVYITGASRGSSLNFHDYTTIKYNKDGNQMWVARYEGPSKGDDVAYGIVIDESIGNLYVTGCSVNSSNVYVTSNDYVTIAYDLSGNELWVARYNGPANSNDIAKAINMDRFGNIFISGASRNIRGDFDFVTVAYDQLGNQLWTARYDGPANDEDFAWAMTVGKSSGNVYVTGRSKDGVSGYDFITVAYDSSGNELWTARYNGKGNGEDRPMAIATDSQENVYVTGKSEDSWTEDDFCTIKYSVREPILQTTINIDPNTLNLKSKGRWITCYITLNDPYDVNDIDISTILLEDTIPAEWGDIQNDTLMVKFDRSEVEDMLSPGTYNLKVTGELTDGTTFEGYSDEIRVIEPP